MTLIHPLTGLRFFAALGVVLCHFALLLKPPAELNFLFNLGGDGVGLFFVLSGYVIAKNLSEKNTGPARLRAYTAERVARIVPLYCFMLLACLTLYVLAGFHLSLHPQPVPDIPQRWASFALNALGLQAWVPDAHVQQFWNAPAWSVSSELFFYALAPWLVPFMLRWPARWLFAGIAGFGVALFAAYHGWLAPRLPPDIAPLFPIRLPLFGLLAFACGIAVYRAHAGHAPGPDEPRRWGVGLPVVALLAAAWVKFHLVPGIAWQIAFFYAAIVPLFAWLIHEVTLCRGRSAQVLGHPLLQALGHASYALYLGHWMVLAWAVHAHPLGLSWAVFGGYLLAMVLASVALYRGFEAPLKLRLAAALRRGRS